MHKHDQDETSATAIERLEARITALEGSGHRRSPRRWRWPTRLAVLLLALALPAMVAANDVFTDVPTSSSFHAVINQVKTAGFTAGCTATTYCPNEPVTRAQMAAFLVRAAGRMDYQTITDLAPVADQPFASVTIKTEGKAQILANATFYANIVRGGSNFYPCQARTYIAIDDVIDQSSYAYDVADVTPTVTGSLTEQIGQQSVKVVNGGTHVVELFYDGVIVGSCGVTVGKGYLTAMAVPFDGLGRTP